MASDNAVRGRPPMATSMRRGRGAVQRGFWRKARRLAAQAAVRRGSAHRLLLRLRPRDAAAGEGGADRRARLFRAAVRSSFPTCCRCVGYTDDAAVLAAAIKLVSGPHHARAPRRRARRAGADERGVGAKLYGLSTTLPITLRSAMSLSAAAVSAERIDRMHVRAELAFAAPAHDVASSARLRLPARARPRAPEHAADVAALQQHQIERQLRDLAGGEADHEIAPLPAERAQRRLGVTVRRPGRRPRRCRARRRACLSASRKSSAGVVHRSSAPWALREGELFVGRGAGDDAGAHELADLDRGEAGAAGGAEHRQRLARLRARRGPSAHRASCRRSR